VNKYKAKQRANPANTKRGAKKRAAKKRHAKNLRRALTQADRVNAKAARKPVAIPAYTIMEQRAKADAKAKGTTPMMARLFGWMPGVNRKTQDRLPGYRYRG